MTRAHRIVLDITDRESIPFDLLGRLQRLADDTVIEITLRAHPKTGLYNHDIVPALLREQRENAPPLAAMPSLTLGFSLSQSLSLKQSLAPPSLASPNWKLADTFEKGGADPLFLQPVQLPVEGLPLEERLQLVDEANEVFHYTYEEEYGEYYKIPLLRDRNICIEDIRIRISRKEYERVKTIIEGAGELQRIVRAVSYSKIRADILNYLASQGVGLDDIVLIGIDRGGRIPALITRWVLGLPRASFLKIDQAGGRGSGQVNEERWNTFIRQDMFRGKYLVFVDSTVDSGRQIEILEDLLDDPANQTTWGHKGWVVVGSNEDGKTLNHHLNINWGVDPDTTFEDSPALLGVDYAGSRSAIIAKPSRIASEICHAFHEVLSGVALDTSPETIATNQITQKVRGLIPDIAKTPLWERAEYLAKIEVPTIDSVSESPRPFSAPSRRLAIIGSESKKARLPDGTASFIARSLAPDYLFNFGTTTGYPGHLLNTLATEIPESTFRYYQPYEFEDNRPFNESGKTRNIHGRPILMTGIDENEKRLHMMLSSDAVLVLPGGQGTLTEALEALAARKLVVVVRGLGAVAEYLTGHPLLRNLPNLYVASSLPEAVATLQRFAKEGVPTYPTWSKEFYQAFQDSLKEEKKSGAFIRELRESLETLLQDSPVVDLSSPYPDIDLSLFEKKLFWALAQAGTKRQSFGQASNDWIQNSVDQVIQAHKAPIAVDVAQLQKQYGANLKGYLIPANDPQQLYLPHLVEIYSATADEDKRAYITERVGQTISPGDAGQSFTYEKEVIRKAKWMEIPEELASRVLAKRWNTESPYTLAHPNFFPELISWYHLNDVQQAHFRRVLFLGSPFVAQLGQEPVIRRALALTANPEISGTLTSTKTANIKIEFERERVYLKRLLEIYETIGSVYEERFSKAREESGHSWRRALLLDDMIALLNAEKRPIFETRVRYLEGLLLKLDEARRAHNPEAPSAIGVLSYLKNLAETSGESLKEAAVVYRALGADRVIELRPIPASDGMNVHSYNLNSDFPVNNIPILKAIAASSETETGKATVAYKVLTLLGDTDSLRALLTGETAFKPFLSNFNATPFLSADEHHPLRLRLARLGNLLAIKRIMPLVREGDVDSFLAVAEGANIGEISIERFASVPEALPGIEALAREGHLEALLFVIEHSHGREDQEGYLKNIVREHGVDVLADAAVSSFRSLKALLDLAELPPFERARSAFGKKEMYGISLAENVRNNRELLGRLAVYHAPASERLRQLDIGELQLRARSDLEALKELVSKREDIGEAVFAPWADKPEVIPVLLHIAKKSYYSSFTFAMALLVQFAEKGELSSEQIQTIFDIQVSEFFGLTRLGHLIFIIESLTRIVEFTHSEVLDQRMRRALGSIDWKERLPSLWNRRASTADYQKIGWLYRILAQFDHDLQNDLPIVELFSRAHQYDWPALKALAEKARSHVRATVAVRKQLDFNYHFPDLANHLTPDAADAFVALAKAGNLTPVTALGNILPAHANEIEPILRQLAPYSPRAASKVAALERERAKQARQRTRASAIPYSGRATTTVTSTLARTERVESPAIPPKNTDPKAFAGDGMEGSIHGLQIYSGLEARQDEADLILADAQVFTDETANLKLELEESDDLSPEKLIDHQKNMIRLDEESDKESKDFSADSQLIHPPSRISLLRSSPTRLTQARSVLRVLR